MRMPPPNTAVSDLIALGRFAAISVAVDDETAGLEADMKKEDLALRASLGPRNQAADDLLEARAKRRVPRRRGVPWLKQGERQCKTSFHGETDSPEYRRILPKSAAKILALPEDERYLTIGNVVAALSQPQTPKELAAMAKAGAGFVAAQTTADAEVKKKQTALSQAILGIHAARAAWLDAYKGLFGQLVAKFKNDRERIESYFMATSTKKVQAPA